MSILFCFLSTFLLNGYAYSCQSENTGVMNTNNHQNADVNETASIQFMRACLMKLDSSQAVIKERGGDKHEKYKLQSFEIDFSNAEMESRETGDALALPLPLCQYIKSIGNGLEPFPEVTAWAEFSLNSKGVATLRVEGSCVPDEFGGMDDEESFYLKLRLLFYDASHAVAHGVLSIGDDYQATVDNVKVIIVKTK